MAIDAARARDGRDGDAMSRILADWNDETRWMARVHTPCEQAEFGRWLIRVSDVTVARAQGVAVGFLSRQGEDIQALYLMRAARGLGIGTRLVQQAQAQCARLGLWTFQANRGGLRFYRARGFVEDRRSDGQGNDQKLADVHLIWQRSV
ncbi:MAG: N-acetyltransferase family protein [Paracoccaceae bacterium]